MSETVVVDKDFLDTLILICRENDLNCERCRFHGQCKPMQKALGRGSGRMNKSQPDPINTMPPEVEEEYGRARFKVTLFVEEMNEDAAKGLMRHTLKTGGADRPDAFTIEEVE